MLPRVGSCPHSLSVHGVAKESDRTERTRTHKLNPERLCQAKVWVLQHQSSLAGYCLYYVTK